MKTLIVSDLHFGSTARTDVLRLPQARESLRAALAGVQRLVLLGDVLELRHGPQREALRAARPFFEELGGAMAGGEIVLVAGNHDHALVEGWLQRRAEQDESPPLGLQQLLTPAQASSMAQRLAEWATPAAVQVAYPGLWVRDDVYAMHGHYLDAHITVPTIERIAVGLMGKMLRRSQQSLSRLEDYEAVTTPIYAWIGAMAAQGTTSSTLNGSTAVRIWKLLDGGSSHAAEGTAPRDAHALPNGATATPRRPLRSAELVSGVRRSAMRRGFPLAVAALDRAGLGPLKPDVSGPELRRAGLLAMGEVAARLGLGDAYVIFGHTHRAGPLPGDDPLEWKGRLGARLINTGSWTYKTGFLASGDTQNPYWPGSCAMVEDDHSSAPRVMRLLLGGALSTLTPTV